jgi:hypothetical protein
MKWPKASTSWRSSKAATRKTSQRSGNISPRGLRSSTNRSWECPSRRPAPAGRKRAIDEEAAQELARVRANEKLLKAQVETRETPTPKPTAARGGCQCPGMRDGGGRLGEADRKADPDYAKKAALVETTCRAIVQRNREASRNPQEAVALAKQALNGSERSAQVALPKPEARREDPSRLIRNRRRTAQNASRKPSKAALGDSR